MTSAAGNKVVLLVSISLLLPLRAAACDASVRSYFYRPSADATPPFECTGHERGMDLSNFNLSGTLDLRATLQFDTCSSLQQLSLACNNFSSIGPGTFQGLSNLQELFLQKNINLRSISSGAFQGLSSLFFLNLNENPVLSSIGA